MPKDPETMHPMTTRHIRRGCREWYIITPSGPRWRPTRWVGLTTSDQWTTRTGSVVEEIMGDPDPPRSGPAGEQPADQPPGRQGPGRRLPKRLRAPSDARPSHLDQWHSDSLFVDPHNWFARRILLILGGVLLACGSGSVVILIADAPGGWELALRLLSTALVIVALAFWVPAFRRHPRPGFLKPMLIAVVALVAAIAAMIIAAWIAASCLHSDLSALPI